MVRDKSFMSLVSSQWNTSNRFSSSLMGKLVVMRKMLIGWNKFHFGNASDKVKSLNADLEVLSSLSRTDINIRREKTIRMHLSKWCIRKEILWRQ